MNTNGLLLEGEEIKPIVGFEDYYVSNLGRTFTNYYSSRWGKSFRILRQRNHPTGYQYVGIYRKNDDGESVRIWKRVHRLVWEAFGGTLKRNQIVDHINELKFDNKLENLQALTHSQNKIKSVRYRKENNK
jgi:hypothetical protein